MADELQNARIDQLPQSAGPKPGFFLAMRNMETGITERIEVDYFLTSTSTQSFEWLTDHEYAVDEVVTRSGRWWQALQINENVVPGTDPLTWVELSKSASGFVFWVAGVFVEDEIFVLYELDGIIGIYYLVDTTRPFVSSDFEAELTAGDWVEISPGQAHFKGVFASEAALDLAFPSAVPGDYAIVDTGGTEAALYIWDDTDTDWVASGVTTIVPPWDDTTAGIVERSTTAEGQNIVTRAAAGSSDASNSDARTPSEKGLVEMLLSFLTTAWTWTLKQTFTLLPRFSGTTASTFLGVDASKDLISRAEATQADMHTGTSQVAVVTPKSVEDKGSIKTVTVSNSATGATNIDCLGRNEIVVIYNTTVTGGITITRSGDSNLEHLYIKIPVTGASIPVTFPSDTRMDRDMESGSVWNQSTKVLTINAIGTADLFEFSLLKSGSIFSLVHKGPQRA